MASDRQTPIVRKPSRVGQGGAFIAVQPAVRADDDEPSPILSRDANGVARLQFDDIALPANADVGARRRPRPGPRGNLREAPLDERAVYDRGGADHDATFRAAACPAFLGLILDTSLTFHLAR
jgi:hypothetical protein